MLSFLLKLIIREGVCGVCVEGGEWTTSILGKITTHFHLSTPPLPNYPTKLRTIFRVPPTPFIRTPLTNQMSV